VEQKKHVETGVHARPNRRLRQPSVLKIKIPVLSRQKRRDKDGAPFKKNYQRQRNRLSVSLSAVVVAGQSAVAAVSAPFFVAALHAAAVIALFVADGAARPAACELGRHFVLQVAGVLCPVAAEVSAGLSLAARTSFPAVSRISALVSSSLCLEALDAAAAEGHWGGQRVESCCSRAADCFVLHCRELHFADRHEWRHPVGRERLRDR
jgi:hypothetical protein